MYIWLRWGYIYKMRSTKAEFNMCGSNEALNDYLKQLISWLFTIRTIVKLVARVYFPFKFKSCTLNLQSISSYHSADISKTCIPQLWIYIYHTSMNINTSERNFKSAYSVTDTCDNDLSSWCSKRNNPWAMYIY